MNRCSGRGKVVLAGLLAVAATLPAGAVTVAPAGEFAARGVLELGRGRIPARCDTTFAGTVTESGAITVTAVSFSGLNPVCHLIAPLGLPWRGQAQSHEHFTLEAMQVDVRAPLLGGVCGPATVTVHWRGAESAAHFERVQLPPNCRLHGTLATTTRLSVTP